VEDGIHAFDKADGAERHTFRVEADDATPVAATTDRLIVGDETGLYGLSS